MISCQICIDIFFDNENIETSQYTLYMYANVIIIFNALNAYRKILGCEFQTKL